MLKKTKNKPLHQYRHLILYAKGHYIVSRFEDDLVAIAIADSDETPEDVRKFVSKLAAQAMKESDDIQTEMFSHLSFIFTRGNEMFEENAMETNKGTAEGSIKILDLELTYDVLDRLCIEAALAIIMRWKLPEDVEIGDPDPSVLPVRDPAVERRQL